ncbi:hypothetical protein Deipr_2709 (plasmid) [Deinococcus proteolyticus MRP]|uniref:Uncharacterized protein n=1 Tax=Deinococcus proteolyticus (strain ATCC 35074 / DSM 20540 / JCM 6276 / NBRC 101906 / NCIMB 13154 / VKM Ac-1939 / CCM 2703 / MRP) TaxID=693977 RepID=F0RRA0_DEIPM|nr:hypothetical protein [Deinococcus proteolyticus]ADY27809.1 hypothetical protein Deipr_2709 [Deinococcus proteolyticus MRP]
MIRRRKKTQRFTQINNEPLRNSAMSLKAKGLLALMMSVPENWVFNIAWLIKQSKDGRDATRAALKELEDHRYVIRRKVMSPPPKTQFVGWEWLVDDTPILDINPDSVVILEAEEDAENPQEEDAPKPGPRVKEGDADKEFPDLLETRLSAEEERDSRLTGNPTVGNPDVGKSTTTNTDLFTNTEKEEEAPVPQAGEQAAAPNASSSEEASPDELLDALLGESEGGEVEGLSSQPTSDAPSRTPDLSEMTTGKGGQQEDQPTAVEKVPAAGGAAAAPANEVAAVNAQLDRYLNRRWLAPYQLGDTVMPPLSTEIVDGLDRAEIPQMVSLEQLRELHNQTRRNISQRKREQATNPGLPGLNYTTELLRMLHEYVEQRLVVREMAQEYQADLRAEAAAAAPQGESAGDLRISGHSEWQVGDQVIYMREPHEIVRITRLKITVALLSDRDIEHDIIRSSMVQNTLRPYRPQQRTG